jgi:CRP/FNR family transcriptional regulator, cyclic AMP receptor protein
MISTIFLKSHALFGGLTDVELDKIMGFMQEKTFSTAEIIITEGESGGTLYFITQGSVEILKRVICSETGNQQSYYEQIAVLKEGDTFGEMELIDIQPRAATVKALEPTATLTLSSLDLYKIQKWNMQTYTMIILNLAREISRRLRKMDELVASTLFHGHKNGK